MSVSRMMRNRCALTISTPGKQVAEIQADDVLEEHEGQSTRWRPAAGTKRGRHVGDLHARELRAPLVPHDDGEVPAAVRDERERVARIERQRRQQREDLAHESTSVRYARTRVRVVFGIDEADASAARARAAANGSSTPPDLPSTAPRDAGRRRAARRGQAIGRQILSSAGALASSAAWRPAPCRTRRGSSRRSPGTSRARAAGDDVRGRLIEDALVEFQPAELAVDVVHGIAQVDLSFPRPVVEMG